MGVGWGPDLSRAFPVPKTPELRPLEDQKHLLPEKLQPWWADLLLAKRATRIAGDAEEMATRLRERGLGFIAALYLSEQITISVRDDLREALFVA